MNKIYVASHIFYFLNNYARSIQIVPLQTLNRNTNTSCYFDHVLFHLNCFEVARKNGVTYFTPCPSFHQDLVTLNRLLATTFEESNVVPFFSTFYQKFGRVRGDSSFGKVVQGLRLPTQPKLTFYHFELHKIHQHEDLHYSHQLLRF